MNRNVFVTGATSGIGLEIARIFAKNGDNVLLAGRRAERLAEIKAQFVKDYQIRVETIVLDVRDRADVEAKVAPAIEALGGIDILINNAGLAQGLDHFQDSDVDDAVTMIDTNVKGLIYVTKQVMPFMIAKNEGHIINIGSTAGITAYEKGTVYCATKAAVKTLSDGMRIDTLPTDIKVTNVQPGIVETDFSTVRFHGDTERAAGVYQGIEALHPEDIADVVYYVTNQPKRVQITDVTVTANQQSGSMKYIKK